MNLSEMHRQQTSSMMSQRINPNELYYRELDDNENIIPTTPISTTTTSCNHNCNTSIGDLSHQVRELLESLDRFTWSKTPIHHKDKNNESVALESETETATTAEQDNGERNCRCSIPSTVTTAQQQPTITTSHREDEIRNWAVMLRNAVTEYKLEQEHLVHLLQAQLVEKEKQIEDLQSTHCHDEQMRKQHQSIITTNNNQDDRTSISPRMQQLQTNNPISPSATDDGKHDRHRHPPTRYYYYSSSKNGNNNGDCEIVFYTSNRTIRERYDQGRFTVWRFENGDVKTQIIHHPKHGFFNNDNNNTHNKTTTTMTTYYYAHSKILQMDYPDSILYLFPDGHVENYDLQERELKPHQEHSEDPVSSRQGPELRYDDP